MARKFFVGGNFKSNGTLESIKAIIDNLNKSELSDKVEVVVAPPALYLMLAQSTLRPEVQVAAQNLYDRGNGAYTGEISASQLKDASVHWVILGHSERRAIFGESDEFVAAKTKAALDGGLSVILCCGESLAEREAGTTIDVVTRQLKAVADVVSDWSKIVVAYEPVWAIGTGKVASTEQAQEAHAAIRKWLKETVSQEASDATRILYGGSVTEKNSAELGKQPDVDGFLVGGASLKPALLMGIQSLTSSTRPFKCNLLCNAALKRVSLYLHSSISSVGSNQKNFGDMAGAELKCECYGFVHVFLLAPL
ncbi:triosephosphate isomerase [Geopyxis carbonaria]|nr:triosephosphate isomerase [Geopyxis carbonaria]